MRQLLHTFVLIACTLSATSVAAQVASQEQRLAGNSGYDDVLRPPPDYSALQHSMSILPGVMPKGTTPRKLRLAFDSDSSHVVATWKRPQAIHHLHLAQYELRMRKDAPQCRDQGQQPCAYAWGDWQAAGPIVASRSSITIYNVDPGTTYEVEVRARNDRAVSSATRASVTIPASATSPPDSTGPAEQR